MTTAGSRQTFSRDDRLAALRHAVYRDVIDFLPAANFDQAHRFAANLALCQGAVRESDAARRQRMVNAVMMRFLMLKVTPDAARTPLRGMTLPELERYMSRKYGDRLESIAGFHRRDEHSPWRLNLPVGCAAYAYRSATGHYSGILFQPLDQLNRFFLLSSSQLGGPKAVRLTPRDQQYFTQFEETI